MMSIHSGSKEEEVSIKPVRVANLKACAGAPSVVPFLGVLRDEGLKNFFTVVTFRVFSLVFFSSNLENGAREECPVCDAAD